MLLQMMYQLRAPWRRSTREINLMLILWGKMGCAKEFDGFLFLHEPAPLTFAFGCYSSFLFFLIGIYLS